MGIRTASEVRQEMKGQMFDTDSSLANKVMDKIDKAKDEQKTSFGEWYLRAEAKQIDLIFSALGYLVTYKQYDHEKDSFYMTVAW